MVADPNEARLKRMMVSSQLRTWPKISMISNRMRIEASIEKVRKALRGSTKAAHMSSDNCLEIEQLESLHPESMDTTNTHSSNTSDAGSGDELIFLSRRRCSMPDGSFKPLKDKDFYKEQNRRRRFMAQFTGSSKDGKNNTQTSSLTLDSDSDAHPFLPSSPEN